MSRIIEDFSLLNIGKLFVSIEAALFRAVSVFLVRWVYLHARVELRR